MKEKPILFSGDMIRAILDGSKTQTRRIVNPPLMNVWGQGVPNSHPNHYCVHARIASYGEPDEWVKCRYGKPGDQLWVRETWATPDNYNHLKPSDLIPMPVAYRATEEYPLYYTKWRPSIFMPRWASRITLEIESIDVEQVQCISEFDALAEGIMTWNDPEGANYLDYSDELPFGCDNARHSFQTLWDSINAKRGYSWDSNPWVWVVKFAIKGRNSAQLLVQATEDRA
jgi:hypothetical protein